MNSSREIEQYFSSNLIPTPQLKLSQVRNDVKYNGFPASDVLPNFANIFANWKDEDGPMTHENYQIVAWTAQSDHRPVGESIYTFLQGTQDEAERHSLKENYEHRILTIFPALLIEQYIYRKLKEFNSVIILCSYDLDTKKKIDFVIQSLDKRYILCIASFMATPFGYEKYQEKAEKGLSFLTANHLSKQLLPFCGPSGKPSPSMDAELCKRT